MAASAAVRAAMRSAHVRRTVVDIMDKDLNLLMHNIEVTDGSVTQDLSLAAGVRTGSLRLPGYAYVPTNAASAFSPFNGHMARIRIEIRTPVGSELVDMGLFLIVSTKVTRPGSVDVTLVDPAYAIDQYRFEDAFQPDRAQPAIDVIKQLVAEGLDIAVGDVTVAHDDTNGDALSHVNDSVWDAGESRWAACLYIAKEFGANIWLDEMRAIHVVSADTITPSVETFDTGSGGLLQTIESEVSRLGVVNRVVVYAEASDGRTQRGVATHDEPTSPLRWNGPLGRLPIVQTFGGLIDLAPGTADAMAERILSERLTLVRQIELTSVPYPMLDAADWIDVKFPNGAVEVCRVQAVTHGLSPKSPTRITARWMPTAALGPMNPGGFLAGEAT